MEGFPLFPASENPILITQQLVRKFIPISFMILKDLKQAFAKHRSATLFSLCLLDFISANSFDPSNCKILVQMLVLLGGVTIYCG